MPRHGSGVDGAVRRPAYGEEPHEPQHRQRGDPLRRACARDIGEREDRVEAPVGEDRQQHRVEPVEGRASHGRQAHPAPGHEPGARRSSRPEPRDDGEVLQGRHEPQLVEVDEGGERGEVGLAVVVGDLCFFAGEIDAGGGDEGLFVEDFFDAAGAGLAGHAVDVVADFLLHGITDCRGGSTLAS